MTVMFNLPSVAYHYVVMAAPYRLALGTIN